MIKLQVIGNLGKDCLINNVNGKNVINFSVAHTEKYKDAQGQQKDKTIWVECAYWTDKTGVAPYLKKGTQIYAEGTPDIRVYTTNDGRQGAALSLRISSVQLLGGRPNEAQQTAGDTQQGYGHQPSNTPTSFTAGSTGDTNEPLDDLPF